MEPQVRLPYIHGVRAESSNQARKAAIKGKPDTLSVPTCINEVWSMDFMHDQITDHRTFPIAQCAR
jgi:hypothetical protein